MNSSWVKRYLPKAVKHDLKQIENKLFCESLITTACLGVGWLGWLGCAIFSSVSEPLIHACLLFFVDLIQLPAALFSSETRHKDNWGSIWWFPGLSLTDVTSRGIKISRSQISVARLLGNLNQRLFQSSRFWWPGHRSVPVRHEHVQIRWRVPTNWKHGDLHLWL